MLPEQTIEFRYDTQLLIEGENLDEDAINDYITENFVGDSLLAVGDEELIKIHYHTNEPWKVLEYCRTLGEIYDIVVEDMDRQARGLQGQEIGGTRLRGEPVSHDAAPSPKAIIMAASSRKDFT